MDGLDDFLGGGEPAPETPPEAQQAPEPAPAPEPVAADAPPPPQHEDDDDEPPVPLPGERTVPLAAYKAERVKRQDHKSEAIRLAEEAKQLRAQLDEFKKAAATPQMQAAPVPAPAPQPAARPPNPIEDPEGYIAYQEQKAQEREMNLVLNWSEQMLRQQHDDVDDVMKVFRAEVEKNPALGFQLRGQPHPYKWAYDTAKRVQALAEIGDPVAYRSKMEADIRAKIEAERAAPPPAPEAPRLPTSLAASRSAAPRSPAVPSVDAFDAAFSRK